MNKRFGRIFAVAVVLLCLMGCGSGNKITNSYFDTAMISSNANSGAFYDESYDGFAYEEESSATGSSEMKAEKVNDSSRKLIKTYNLNVETEAYDTMMTALENRISDLGGYIQDMNSYNGSKYSYSSSVRSANITARVPAKYLEQFVEFVGNTANITRKSVSVEDVTLSYVDTESKKATYEIEQERLLALLEKAESIEDMITIEARLSEVRYKLESQESLIRTYDNLVDYATVNISVTEVEKYTEPEPEKYWDRVGRAFSNGVSDVCDGLSEFFISFMGALPGLVVFAVFVAVVVIIIRAITKGSRKRKQKKTEDRATALMNSAKETASKKAEENAKQ